MTTTGELCRLLSATLHLPDVDRWAVELVSRELLPGMDHEVTALDAALLLAAVVAVPNPPDVPRVVVALASLPLISTRRCVGGAELEAWARCTDADIAAMPSDPLDALATAIEQEPFPENRFYFGSLKIEENGASAELIGSLGDDLQACRARFYLPDSGLPSGLTRTAEIHSDVIGSIANALWPPPPDQVVSRYETASIIH